MDAKYGETLSAFFDGERVDPGLLEESLAQPGAAALLAEFAEMRRYVLNDPARPSPEFCERMRRLLRRSTVRRRLIWLCARFALAASLLLIAALAGFGLGRMGAERPALTAISGQVAKPVAGLPQTPITLPSALTPPVPKAATPEPPRAARARPPVRTLPPASLRLRFWEWQDASPEAEEGRGRR